MKESDTFPVSKGWHGVKNVEKDVTLDIIPLKFCVIYRSLHVEVDNEDVAQIANINECRMPPKSPHPNTRYFVSANFGQEPFSCQYGQVVNMKNPIVTFAKLAWIPRVFTERTNIRQRTLTLDLIILQIT